MDRENSPALDGRQLSARRWSVRSQLGKYCRRSKPTTQTSKQGTLDVFYGGQSMFSICSFRAQTPAFDFTNSSGSTHWIWQIQKMEIKHSIGSVKWFLTTLVLD